jgi:paraquat-inducible protein B
METPAVEKAVIKKKKGISPIWILPIVALIIGGWLLYKNFRDAGINIVVHFPTAEGIKIDKTQVMYKGIPVGTVRDIVLHPEIDGVAVHIEMDRRTKLGLVEDTKFWIVEPEVSAGRVQGLSTLLTGNYIGVRRGISKVPCYEFTGLTDPPPLPLDAPGLRIKLTSKTLGSIQRNTQIYYKNIIIGSVQSYKLDKEGDGIIIDAYIEPNYKHLIKTKTRFWNSSGIHFKGGLSGFKFRMESLASLMYGGISCYTPSYQFMSQQASNGHTYTLYEDFDEAEYGLKMTLQLTSAEGIEAGITKVMYRGFKAGVVTDITFDEDKQVITAHINVDPRAEFILREGSRFWVVKPEFSVSRVRNLDTLIKGSYIAFTPGNGIYRDYFIAQAPPATKDLLQAGKRFKILADNAKSLSIGAPVLYQKLKVGEIANFDLEASGNRVKGEILIYKKYTHLLKEKAVFWKTGGIRLDAGLDGITVESGTIDTLVAGGISFTVPVSAAKSRQAMSKSTVFKIYESYREAAKKSPALQASGLRVELKAPEARSISLNAPVLYKQIEVGKVVGRRLADAGDDIVIDVFIAKKYAHLLKDSSVFYNVSGITVNGGLSGIELKTDSLKSIIVGGISFMTPTPGKPATAGQQYILYANREEARNIDKKLISITFANSRGLKKGTEIRYHDIVIGRISKVDFNTSMDAVICQALVDRRAVKLFTTDTLVWLISPEVSLAGINNLETVVTGPYITLRPGKGSPVSHITALDEAPALEKTVDGLNIILESDRLGSLKKNSPLYYRQIQIGRVTGARLSPTAQRVFIYVNINPPYNRLVHENTKFWNASGIRVRAGIFSGVKINTESVTALVAGGISMATPEGKKMGKKVAEGTHFLLHGEAKDCWLGWQPSIPLEN